jgi:hypothetical protein
MRINHTKRIFMTEEDGSPGGGAAPLAQPAPIADQPAPESAPNVTPDQVKSWIGEALGGFKNEFFANARRAGLLGKEKPTAETPPSAAPAMTGLTEADLEARLEQERVITRVQVEHKLPDSAVKRMKNALKAERPEDVSAWTSSYLADLGLARTTEPSTPPAAHIPVVPNAAPISDRGSPAPNGSVGWRYELSNPIGMSAAARAQMDAELGVEKARKMRLEAARNQAGNLRVAFGPKG